MSSDQDTDATARAKGGPEPVRPSVPIVKVPIEGDDPSLPVAPVIGIEPAIEKHANATPLPPPPPAAVAAPPPLPPPPPPVIQAAQAAPQAPPPVPAQPPAPPPPLPAAQTALPQRPRVPSQERLPTKDTPDAAPTVEARNEEGGGDLFGGLELPMPTTPPSKPERVAPVQTASGESGGLKAAAYSSAPHALRSGRNIAVDEPAVIVAQEGPLPPSPSSSGQSPVAPRVDGMGSTPGVQSAPPMMGAPGYASAPSPWPSDSHLTPMGGPVAAAHAYEPIAEDIITRRRNLSKQTVVLVEKRGAPGWQKAFAFVVALFAIGALAFGGLRWAQVHGYVTFGAPAEAQGSPLAKDTAPVAPVVTVDPQTQPTQVTPNVIVVPVTPPSASVSAAHPPHPRTVVSASSAPKPAPPRAM